MAFDKLSFPLLQNQATSSSILEKVDAALYQAKATGRSKVICA